MGRFVAGDIEGGVIVADRRRLLADLTPLRESAAFRRLWAGTTLSSVGGALTAFAVMLQVYDLTHSSLAVGAIGVAQMVPTIAVGVLCGPVVDAIDRRKLVLVTSGCLALVSAALAAQAFAGLDLLWLLYALVAVQSSLGAVDRPARSTFVPALLPPPVPMVPFVLAAGALNYPRRQFLLAITAGRAIRYTLLAMLASIYGRHILRFIRHYQQPVLWAFIALLALSALAGVGYYLWRKHHSQIREHERKAA